MNLIVLRTWKTVRGGVHQAVPDTFVLAATQKRRKLGRLCGAIVLFASWFFRKTEMIGIAELLIIGTIIALLVGVPILVVVVVIYVVNKNKK